MMSSTSPDILFENVFVMKCLWSKKTKKISAILLLGCDRSKDNIEFSEKWFSFWIEMLVQSGSFHPDKMSGSERLLCWSNFSTVGASLRLALNAGSTYITVVVSDKGDLVDLSFKGSRSGLALLALFQNVCVQPHGSSRTQGLATEIYARCVADPAPHSSRKRWWKGRGKTRGWWPVGVRATAAGEHQIQYVGAERCTWPGWMCTFV